MNKKLTKLMFSSMLVALSVMVFAASANAAVLTWTGAGDNTTFDDLGNWDAAPTGGVIDTNALVDEYNVDDPTFNVARTAPLKFVSGGGLNFSAGALTLTGGTTGLGVLETPDTFGFLNQSGGTITSQFLAEMIVVLSGDAEMILNGGGNPVNVTTIDFTSLTSSIHFLNETPARVTIEHLSKITVNGVAAVEGVTLQIVSDGGTKGSIVTAIPEPASLILLSLGGLAALKRQRS